MTAAPATNSDDEASSTALVERVLAAATEVLVIDASVNELGRADAARIIVSGKETAELARPLAVVSGGTAGAWGGPRSSCRTQPATRSPGGRCTTRAVYEALETATQTYAMAPTSRTGWPTTT